MSISIYTPETTTSPDTGVVYYNQLGASTHEAAGRDAEHLAEALGVIVMAVDRPGSGRSMPTHGRKLQEDYITAIATQGKTIATEADRHELKSIVTSGRSAGGLAALALACTETVPVVGVTAKEPIGMYRTTAQEGGRAYAAYSKRQKATLAEARRNPDSKLILPEPTDVTGFAVARRALSIAYCAVVDRQNNKNVWSQPLAQDAALRIARHMPDIRTEMLFAEDSMAASREQIALLAAETEQLRAEALIDDGQLRQAFTVRALPNTTHSSFDLRSFYQEQDKRFLAEMTGKKD